MSIPKWKQDLIDRKAREDEEKRIAAGEKAQNAWIDNLVDSSNPNPNPYNHPRPCPVSPSSSPSPSPSPSP